jgi:hypothetical protein
MSDSESEVELHPFVQAHEEEFENLYELTETIKDLQKQLLQAKRDRLAIERELCDAISQLDEEDQMDPMVYKNLSVVYSTKTALNIAQKKSSKKSKK